MEYYVSLYGPLKLYKTACFSDSRPPQLYVYQGDCVWRKISDPDKLQGILSKIDEIEANIILEKIEGGNYFVCDGFVGVYD